jgi:predicted O-linked N-acetylglucosamine transferase (SPINDLY family)
MASAIVASIGCSEPACTTLEACEAMAVALAMDPERMRGLRERVRQSATASPLFDPQAQACGVEQAWVTLWHAFCNP